MWSWFYSFLFFIIIIRLIILKPKAVWLMILSIMIVLYGLTLFFIKEYNLFANLGRWIDDLFNYSIRNHTINWINSLYDEKTCNFINLILFNIRVDQTSEFYQMTIEMGIVYLICVSGFHLSILKKIIHFIFKKMKLTEYLISNTLILFYVYLLNFSFGSLRVLICSLITPLIKKYNLNIYQPLAISGILLLFIVPCCPNYMSFTLSYIGTISVFIVVNFKMSNLFFEKILINIMATIATLPFVLMMNSEISLLAVINGFIFSYLFSFIFIYFLLFSWIPFFSVIHNFIVDVVLFIIGYYGKNNIIVNLREFEPWLNTIYYLTYSVFIGLINNKIKV